MRSIICNNYYFFIFTSKVRAYLPCLFAAGAKRLQECGIEGAAARAITIKFDSFDRKCILRISSSQLTFSHVPASERPRLSERVSERAMVVLVCASH